MKLIFDFDHTIFDMTQMHVAIVEAMKGLGIDEETYAHAYNAITHWKAFTLDSLSARLRKEANVEPAVVAKAMVKLAQDSALYVYDDVESIWKILRHPAVS